MTAALRVAGVTKSFGSVKVLKGVDFHVELGQTAAIVGPSGCGKTTLLRVIAGFEAPDQGSVSIGDRVLTGPGRSVSAHRRRLGYVAQDGALFPHLTVAQNIGFGLSGRTSRNRVRIEELLALVSLDRSYLDRRPHELSGGQQQRVSLARALAPSPDLVLLDEPFSALDTGLRVATREAVAKALAAQGVTTILVTHDHAEALSFADRVGVMLDGKLRQYGRPAVVYRAPVDTAVAQLLGDAILLPAVIRSGTAECELGVIATDSIAPDGPASIVVRPEHVRLVPGGTQNTVAARVVRSSYQGHESLVRVVLPSGLTVLSRSTAAEPYELDASVGIELTGTAHCLAADPSGIAAADQDHRRDDQHARQGDEER
jgi:iron(III) transport system ATP-binding protein